MFKGFLKYEKLNSEIKLSINSSFVILIFAILKSQNIGRSTFSRSKIVPSTFLVRSAGSIKLILSDFLFYPKLRKNSNNFTLFFVGIKKGVTHALKEKLN